MRRIGSIFTLAAGLGLIAVLVFAQTVPAIQKVPDFAGAIQENGHGAAAAKTPAAPENGAHMDHKSKHGGTFFMALDNQHHLEGILVAPATFRVYLYDDHTKPLKAEETRKASGTIQVGESDDAPTIAVVPGKKKDTLEANLGGVIKFPLSLTLLLHLPGMAPDAKPELFNFTFVKFTDQNGPGSCHPMASMPNMHC